MSGSFSRNKGKRAEYDAVDHFRRMNMTATRVPLSGASPGDKGDVRIEQPLTRFGDRPMDARFWYGEVKSRATAFKSIYHFFRTAKGLARSYAFTYEDVSVIMSYDWKDLGFLEASAFEFKNALPQVKGAHNIARKILRLQALLKGADFLAIKGDYHPLIFIRFFN